MHANSCTCKKERSCFQISRFCLSSSVCFYFFVCLCDDWSSAFVCVYTHFSMNARANCHSALVRKTRKRLRGLPPLQEHDGRAGLGACLHLPRAWLLRSMLSSVIILCCVDVCQHSLACLLPCDLESRLECVVNTQQCNVCIVQMSRQAWRTTHSRTHARIQAGRQADR